MKQLDIIDRELARLQADSSVLGVMLIGSLAGGYATEYSDVDLYILCDRDAFEADWIDGVLVERTFATPETARRKIDEAPMEAYRWQNAQLIHDPQGLLAGLAEGARQAYEAYTPPERLKWHIAHWLVTLELKLTAALESGDLLKASYLASTNAWMLLEAMWAVNSRPMPPSGTAYQLYQALERVPCADWFPGIFQGTLEQRAAHTRSLITWALPILQGETV